MLGVAVAQEPERIYSNPNVAGLNPQRPSYVEVS